MGGYSRKRFVACLAAGIVGAAVAVLPMLDAEAAPTAARVSGADRYATSAAVSAQSFSPGVPVAYLATGEQFPDALAGGPAGAKTGGPVLLTKRDSLPDATKAELDRLNPEKIVVLGGTNAVSQAVQEAAAPFTNGQTTRISGATRWDTAAQLSAATFSAPVNTVYVATGVNFPDALAGGPAAGGAAGGSPLLLVDTTSIPTATATELQRLSAQQVIVLGGPSVVSESVLAALDPYSVSPVVRRAGADRYLTSVAISSNTFASASKVYLATGSNFPDALAAGSPAGIAKAPLLLAQPTCVTPEVNAEITRLNPQTLVVLGGEAALSAAVLSRTICQPPTTTTTAAPPQQNCTPGYSKCLAPGVGDWDCAGGGGNGPNFVDGPLNVSGSDPYDLDSNNDGVGCES